MNFGGTIKRLGLAVLDLVFPISCLLCGRGEVYLCEACLGKLPRLPHQFCAICQQPSAFGKTHPGCVSRNTVDGSISALPYADPSVKKLIATFKYNFISDLAPILSQLIIEAVAQQNLNDYFSEFEIVPIPLHRRRLNWRGFNQAELLAKPLALTLNIQFNPTLAKRQKSTKPQITLKADERKRNISEAFSLNDLPVNKKIILVDDVVTSGATANELAKLLKRNGVSEVWVLAAAHG